MWPKNNTLPNYNWGIIAYKINGLGFKETFKMPGYSDIPNQYQKQGWKFLKKY